MPTMPGMTISDLRSAILSPILDRSGYAQVVGTVGAERFGTYLGAQYAATPGIICVNAQVGGAILYRYVLWWAEPETIESGKMAVYIPVLSPQLGRYYRIVSQHIEAY